MARVQQPVIQSAFDRGPAIPLDGSCGRGNAGFLAPGQSRLSINCDQINIASGQTIPLPTPPTGKTWFWSDIYFSHDQNSVVRFSLTVGTVTVWSAPCHGSTAPDALPGLETQSSCPEGVVPKLVMGSVNSGKGYANLQGFLQPTGGG